MCVSVGIFHLHVRVYLEPQLQVWVQAAGAWGAPCTFCTEVGGWVPRLGSCDVQWKLFDTLIEGNCKSSFLFTIKHMVIKSTGPQPGCCWYHSFNISWVLSHVQLFVTPWTIAHQAPLSMEFSRQEYWSGLPFLSPGGLPHPGIEPGSPAL